MKTELKIAGLCVTGFLLVGMICELAFQRQSLSRVLGENESLRQQLDDLTARAEQLGIEKQQLAKLAATNEADNSASRAKESSRELLRLRGEVARLRPLEKDAEQSLRGQMQAAQANLTNAEIELARLTRLRSEGAVSGNELSKAEFAVELLKAEAKGDMVEAARIRLRQAEFSRATELRSQSLISQTEYEEAVRKVEVLRAGTGP
jgi:hypothetical protein